MSSFLTSRVVCWVPSEQYDYKPVISKETGGAALLSVHKLDLSSNPANRDLELLG